MFYTPGTTGVSLAASAAVRRRAGLGWVTKARRACRVSQLRGLSLIVLTGLSSRASSVWMSVSGTLTSSAPVLDTIRHVVSVEHVGA
jgi:hypothetical protein